MKVDSSGHDLTRGPFAFVRCDRLKRVPLQRFGWLLESRLANGYYWDAGFAWRNVTRFARSGLSYVGEVPRIDGMA